jgi:flagellar motor switch protein FliM
MVSRLLGGTAEGEKKPRLITRIEQSIVKGIIARALSDLQRAWKTIADLTFKLERYESEGDFAQIAPTSEIVLVVSFEVSIGDQKYIMNLCFPTFALDDVLAKLNIQNFSNIGAVDAHGEWSGAILARISDTPMGATCVLGETSLTLRELLQLERGDILRSGIPISGEIQLIIGGKVRLWGRPGTSNGRFAIKITRSTHPE